MFACLYAGLCDTAREHGYALAIHGTVTTDLDLIAVPWTPQAVPARQLKDALLHHIGACGYADLLRKMDNHLSEETIQQIVDQANNGHTGEDGCEIKPHGRLAWNLYLDFGVKVDLSIMPLFPVNTPNHP